MLKKIASCGLLIAVFIGPALAQTPPSPKPSPSPAQPKPGTRAYTEAIYEALKKSFADYTALCGKSDSTLASLDQAHADVNGGIKDAYMAAFDEADQRPNVIAAKDAFNHAKLTYDSLAKRANDYVAELKAKAAMEEADKKRTHISVEAFDDIHHAVRDKVLGQDPISMQNPCPRHATLLAAAKAAALLAAPKTATGPAKPADDCNKGGGLSGPLEKLACQEGK